MPVAPLAVSVLAVTLAVIGVALGIALVALAVWLVRQNQPHNPFDGHQHPADPSHPLVAARAEAGAFEGLSEEQVRAAADRALLLSMDAVTLTAAALRMHEDDSPQAVEYLLHALRRVHHVHRDKLFDALVSRGPAAVAREQRLFYRLPSDVRRELRRRLAADEHR